MNHLLYVYFLLWFCYIYLVCAVLPRVVLAHTQNPVGRGKDYNHRGDSQLTHQDRVPDNSAVEEVWRWLSPQHMLACSIMLFVVLHQSIHLELSRYVDITCKHYLPAHSHVLIRGPCCREGKVQSWSYLSRLQHFSRLSDSNINVTETYNPFTCPLESFVTVPTCANIGIQCNHTCWKNHWLGEEC